MSESPDQSKEDVNSSPNSPELNIDESPCGGQEEVDSGETQMDVSEAGLASQTPSLKSSVDGEIGSGNRSEGGPLPLEITAEPDVHASKDSPKGTHIDDFNNESQVDPSSPQGDLCISTGSAPQSPVSKSTPVSPEPAASVPSEKPEEQNDVQLNLDDDTPKSPGNDDSSEQVTESALNAQTENQTDSDVASNADDVDMPAGKPTSPIELLLSERETAEVNEGNGCNDDDNLDESMDVTQTSPAGSEKDAAEASDGQEAESKEAVPPEDLEDGELPESDEEEDSTPQPKDKTTPSSILELEIKMKKSIEKEKSKEREKEKEREKKKKEKEKEKDKERKKEKEKKKRRHSDEENKSSKSKRKKEDEPAGDDTEYLYVRGASPGKPVFGNEEDFGSRGEFDEGEEFDRRGGREHRGRRREERGAMTAGRGRGPSEAASRKNETKPPKTDMICMYYMQGKCQKSADDCNFSHDAVPPRKMELCKFWMMDCCAKKEKCLYLHNDFPCKFYHTGLICKLGDKCKFSHQPLNEQTKNVLLKHIETAPKEILGDFPRLNRAGALNLINKMEAKIASQMKRERADSPNFMPNHHHQPPFNQSSQPHPGDSHHDRNQRRTRWEQPTRDDQEKLHELMEEAGIGNFYKEATEQHNEPPHSNTPPGHQPSSQAPHMIPPPVLHPPMVNNPTLANVLASLNIPSSTIAATQNSLNPFIPDAQFLQSLQLLSAAAAGGPNGPTPQQIHQATQAINQQLQNFQQGQLIGSPAVMAPLASVSSGFTASPTVSNVAPSPNNDKQATSASPPTPAQPSLENLPKMQREIFKRIQNMQMKKEQEVNNEKVQLPLDDDWYSSEDEEKEKPADPRQQVRTPASAPIIPAVTAATSLSLKDVDLRAMPFGDTDFRLPPLRSGDSFQDVDLRSSDSSGFKKPPADIPATEIEAGVSSHAGIPWKVVLVAGVRKIDYSYIRGSPQASSLIGNDPRLTSLRSSTSNVPLGPASPPPMQNVDSVPPIGIPSASDFSDPRMRRNMRDAGGRPGGQDSQLQQLKQSSQGNQPLFPSNLPSDLTPAAFAQLMQTAAAASGNPGAAAAFLPPGAPFMSPDFMNMAAVAAQAAAAAALQQQQQSVQQNMPRQPFHQPKSSWESRYQGGGSGGVTPPL